MRIVFIGSVHFSKLALQKLLVLEANIVGLITKRESAFNSDFEDLSGIAVQNNIPYKYVNDINHENNVSWIANLCPDVIFCFGLSNLIKTEILNIPRLGVIGYHPALLPNNRGRHPLVWAKVLGLPKTGSTFFFMDEGADSGDILSQKEIDLHFEDTAETIYNRMIEVALIQIEEFLPKLTNGQFSKIPQLKEAGNEWRKRGINDGRIDFRMTSESICNLVRGLDRPYIGAHCDYQGKHIKVWKIDLGHSAMNNIEPGRVLSISKNSIEVKAGSGSVLLLEHVFVTLPNIGDYIV